MILNTLNFFFIFHIESFFKMSLFLQFIYFFYLF